ncbi:MAG: GNAT family N-acetyltransferase [Desulfobacterales bacterium]
MSVIVRPATLNDKDQCLSLISTLSGKMKQLGWEETYTQLLDGERGGILVAEEDGVILGTVTISYNLAIRYGGEYCQLEELIVNEEARGKNAGGILVQAAVDCARVRGCAEMGLYLIERTEGNRPFYEKYGFEYVGSEMRQQLK